MKLLKQLRWTLACSGTSLKRGFNENGTGSLSAYARILVFALTAALLAQPQSVLACAACYGQSDSPLASGVTWGILSLLVVVMGVLGSIVTFFVYINKKSAAIASKAPITDPLTHHASRVTSFPSPVTSH